MTRKSRLSTSWQRLAPQIDRLIEAEIGSSLISQDANRLRSLSRTLACWCVRLTHSKLNDEALASLFRWMKDHSHSPYGPLAEILFRHNCVTGGFKGPLAEIAVLAKTRVLTAGAPPPTPLDIVNRVHELLLWLEAPQDRRDRGAYYTPQAVAQVLLQLAHERLVSMTPDGQGLWCPQARVLDFAAGTGSFFAAALELRGQHPRILPHWLGIEIDTETHAISQFCQACQQLESGLQMMLTELPRLLCGDSLLNPVILTDAPDGRLPPFNVIVGNPPYAALRGANVEWLDDLLRGKDPFSEHPRASYHSEQKQSSKNRKHSLADDYVRFLRIAHWQIEQSGYGVIALILNHGILENSSFRELRESLNEYFDEVLFLDLHGNAKRRELTPQGGRDESIFNIEQGTMIAVLSKWPTPRPKRLQIGHIYGLRDEKIARLVSREWESELEDVAPSPPQFYFHCQRRSSSRIAQTYAKAPSLTDILPLHSTAIVTARDSLVVDTDLDRLRSRIADLGNLAISDDEIRARYFSEHRHKTYALGDTRSWKLERVRRLLVEEGDDTVRFVGFWYRPWDYRWLAYSKHLIDWRRERFTPLLLDGNNLSLVARRQSPPGAECNYVWTTNSVVLDGILRSDNRGTESVFPLFGENDDSGKRICNLESTFFNAMRGKLDLNETQLFQAIVAMLHCRAYQTAFRDELCREFPRVLLPNDRATAARLAMIGERIAEIECMTVPAPATPLEFPFQGEDAAIKAGFPRHRDGAIWINETTHWENVTEDLWNFRAGAHQPIRRWLKQRQGAQLGEPETQHVSRTLVATGNLLAALKELDELIPAAESLEENS